MKPAPENLLNDIVTDISYICRNSKETFFTFVPLTVSKIQKYGHSKKTAERIATAIRNDLRESLKIGNLFIETQDYIFKSKTQTLEISFFKGIEFETIDTTTGEILDTFKEHTLQDVQIYAKKNKASFKLTK